MQLKCSCGKILRLPEEMAGKQGKCPGCGKVFHVPAAKGAPAAADGKIVFKCGCGRSLAVPAAGAGKSIRCPGCAQTVRVPFQGSPGSAAAPSKAAVPEFGEDLELEFDDGMPPPDLTAAKTPPHMPPPPEAEGARQAFDLADTTPEARDEKPAGDEYDVTPEPCPTCGRNLEPGAGFCVHCGTNLRTGVRMDTAPAVPQKKKGPGIVARFHLVKVAKLLVLAAILLGVLILYTRVLVPLYDRLTAEGNGDSAAGSPGPRPPARPDEGATPPRRPQGPPAAKTEAPEPAEEKGLDYSNVPVEKPDDEWFLATIVYTPKRAQDKMLKHQVEQSVKAFQAINGRLPASLAEAARDMPFRRPPEGTAYLYDPETGQVELGRTREIQAAQAEEKWPEKWQIFGME
jgi:hypothetical protein